MTKRVWHPTANAWWDVPEDQVSEWKKSGWLASKPSHADDTNAEPVALQPEPVDVTGSKGAEVPIEDNTPSNSGRVRPVA